MQNKLEGLGWVGGWVDGSHNCEVVHVDMGTVGTQESVRPSGAGLPFCHK